MEKIYLNKLNFHIRKFRPTTLFSKVEEKGEFYATPSLDKTYSNLNSTKIKIIIPLPKDLQEKINNGEVQLMVPKDYFANALRDTYEYIIGKAKAERIELIHTSRNKTWSK